MSVSDGITLPVGTWELVSLVSERPDGSTFEPFGPRPSGRIIYDEAGHVTAMIVGEQRNEATGKPSPTEFLMQFTAYFGTYRVDAVRGEIVHNVTTSLNGPQASGELRRHYRMENGRFFLSFSRMRDGREVISRLEWKRISPL
jgi:hypothetical protein